MIVSVHVGPCVLVSAFQQLIYYFDQLNKTHPSNHVFHLFSVKLHEVGGEAYSGCNRARLGVNLRQVANLLWG